MRLQDYSKAGITNLEAAHIYDHLKARRENNSGKRSMLEDVLNHIQV